MAFSLDMDIYSWLLEEVLKVSPSGDPVNDAVYLILLPMVVLYMYADFVISKSRFMGSHGKFKYIMMFIVGFVIVREGYYAFFASMSLPLLGLIMIWHAFSFVMGWGQRGNDTQRETGERVGWRSGGGGDSGWSGLIKSKIPLFSAANLPAVERTIKELKLLGQEWEDIRQIKEIEHLDRLPENMIEQKKNIRRQAQDKLDGFDDTTKGEILNRVGSPKDFVDELRNLIRIEKNEER